MFTIDRRSPVWLAMMVGLLALAAAAAGALVALTGYLALAVIVVSAGFAALFVIPPRMLPLVSLGILFTVPINYLPLPSVLRHAPVAAIPLAVWAFRERRSGRLPVTIAALTGALMVWAVLTELLAPAHTRIGLAWFFAFLLAPCLVLLASPRMNVDRFVSAFLGLASVTGLYALLETFVLQSNPIYAPLYSSAGTPLLQVWDSYRATTSIGHPLANSTVFAVGAVMALDRSFTRTAGRRTKLLQCAILLAAVAATKSRGAGIAVAAGVVVVLALRWHTSGTFRKVAVLAVVAIGSIGIAAVLGARNTAVEAQKSAGQRSTLLRDTNEALAGHRALGVGPGESEQFRNNQGLSTARASPLENSYAETAVSLGIPGFLLLAALLSALIVMGLRRSETVALGAGLLTFAVSIGGYNALEGHPPMLVLMTLLSQGIVLTRVKRSTDPLPARNPSGWMRAASRTEARSAPHNAPG